VKLRSAGLDLYRSEVFENQRVRLHGDVLLARTASNWTIIGVLVSIVVAALISLSTGQYARTEKAIGRIVPDGAMTRIVPSRAGVVTKLYVREGDAVKSGQPLATVLVAQASSDRADPAGADLNAIDQQHALINQQITLSRQSQANDAAKLSANISQDHAELASLGKQIARQTRLVQSARDSFEPLTSVMKEGFVSKTQYERQRQSYLASEVQLAQMQTQSAELAGQLREAEVALTDVPTETATKIDDLMTSQASLVEKRIDVENGRSYVITAPVAGRISALQVRQGSTVANEVPIMTIVNDGARMVAELYAPSRAIGFARPGQEVRLMYDAFPYQRFGSFVGHITEISHTVLAPKEVDAAIEVKEPVYQIRVALADQTIDAYGERVPLQPGMTLDGNIVLERRSFLDWLLEPINAVRNRA
jgi:membrane fusion protein